MQVPILHFSDVLCIYAYLGQVRIDELKKAFESQVTLDLHFCQVFGDAAQKIGNGWSDRGGFAGYNRHIHGIASRYTHVRLHPEVWTKAPPTGSLSAHLFLKGLSVLEATGEAAQGVGEASVVALRRAFFEQARDVSHRDEQMALTEELGVDRSALERTLDSGLAHAALARDLELARKHEVTMSPTLIFNDGRQRLNGNVGFRIIEANVRELIRVPQDEASWC